MDWTHQRGAVITQGDSSRFWIRLSGEGHNESQYNKYLDYHFEAFYEDINPFNRNFDDNDISPFNREVINNFRLIRISINESSQSNLISRLNQVKSKNIVIEFDKFTQNSFNSFFELVQNLELIKEEIAKRPFSNVLSDNIGIPIFTIDSDN